MVVLQDVTAKKKAVQMRADFVANITHELRSPLSALRDITASGENLILRRFYA